MQVLFWFGITTKSLQSMVLLILLILIFKYNYSFSAPAELLQKTDFMS